MTKILEISVEDVSAQKDRYILVDVREPHELTGPEGQIDGNILATLGPDLERFLGVAPSAGEYVFICRSGYRSGKACEMAYGHGISKAYNLTGGMLAWKEWVGKMAGDTPSLKAIGL